MSAEFVVIFVTASTEEEAKKIESTLLDQRKAACVNIILGVKSFFWWKGEIETAQEVLLVIKTKTSKLNEIIRIVKEIHSYETPEIIALPIIGGNEDYLRWIGKEVRG